MDKEQFISNLNIDGTALLIDAYSQYDELMKSLSKKHDYGCIAKCGACCHTPSQKIEVSVFEMVPMAIELFRLNRADEVYDQLELMDTEQSVCIAYHRVTLDGKHGHCTMHKTRPLICRLFAGGSIFAKDGQRKVLLCRPLKDRYVGREQMLTDLALELPIVKEFASELRELNPDLSKQMWPINEGLKHALSLILTRWFYASHEESSDKTILDGLSETVV